MKKTLNYLLLVIAYCMIFSSCTIQKRVHLPGYHVEWSNNKPEPVAPLMESESMLFEKTEVAPQDDSLKNHEQSENRGSSQTKRKDKAKKTLGSETYQSKTQQKLKKVISACDVLRMTSGERIEAKILEITPYEIKYKNCDNIEGPTIVISRSSVKYIDYANGSRTVITEDNNYNQNTNSSDLIPEKGSGDRSIIVAIALWFFFGLIGIHRLYLGHYGIGILYLLTLGVCGIGWLIDGVLFLTGDLTPKRGEYIDSL